MPPEDEAAVEAESASDDTVSEDPSESNSEEQGEGEAESESTGAPEGEDEGEPAESESDEGQQAAGDDEDPEYKNLVAKFAHITNPRDRNAAIGRAFWEKVRYDSQVRKENERLKLELARREGATPKKDEPPPPPPPDVEKAINKIKNLYQRGESLQAERTEVVAELNKADREVAIAEDRLKDTDENDERRPLAQARLRQAKLELDSARGRYRNINERQEALEDRLETAMAEKDWMERFHKDQQQRQKDAQVRGEAFNEQFPQQVEGLVTAAAKHVELKLDERLSASLSRHVNRALQADIRGQYLETDLEDIPIPQMVLEYVKEWAEDRDLTKRQDFKRTSEEKLRVASRVTTPGDRKAPGTTPKPTVPASLRPPVPTALLSRNTTPAMAKARRLLVSRFG